MIVNKNVTQLSLVIVMADVNVMKVGITQLQKGK